MIQQIQTNKCYSSHKENQGQKSCDHLNRYKAFDEIQHPFIIKALKKLRKMCHNSM
jgi:hypothetical protein